MMRGQYTSIINRHLGNMLLPLHMYCTLCVNKAMCYCKSSSAVLKGNLSIAMSVYGITSWL